MSDDSSKDAEVVEYIDSQDEDDPDSGEKRPIMLLLRRLIRNKQNTVMTNAQIVDILSSEFDISVKTSHELEVDIYVKIIKKYLKDWPQWEELERIATKLNKIKDYEAVSKVLNHKYKNLKEYLDVMLKAAQPLAKEAVKTIKVPENKQTEAEHIDMTDVVMEIQCSKEQLNHLFYRRPRLDLNNTVFNISDVAPSRISLKTLSTKQILNGWCLKITVSLPNFFFVRELAFNMKHVLVNRVHHESVADVTLPTTLQTLQRDQVNKAAMKYKLNIVIKQFHEMLEMIATQSYDLYSTTHLLLEMLVSELKDTLDKDFLFKIPASFRRYTNKHKYVRYVYTENEQNNDPRYDLQLEETIAPILYFNIRKCNALGAIPPIEEWLKIECMICKVTLPCLESSLESHFNDVHQNETDWQCTHCKMLFSIEYLSNNKWYHEC